MNKEMKNTIGLICGTIAGSAALYLFAYLHGYGKCYIRTQRDIDAAQKYVDSCYAENRYLSKRIADLSKTLDKLDKHTMGD